MIVELPPWETRLARMMGIPADSAQTHRPPLLALDLVYLDREDQQRLDGLVAQRR